MTWYEGVAQAGYKRVIVVGTAEQMDGPEFRRPLAASGVLVLVPAREQRERIARIAACGPSDGDEAWLRAVLEHGIEHGAQALVACEPRLADCVESLGLAVPVVRPVVR